MEYDLVLYVPFRSELKTKLVYSYLKLQIIKALIIITVIIILTIIITISVLHLLRVIITYISDPSDPRDLIPVMKNWVKSTNCDPGDLI